MPNQQLFDYIKQQLAQGVSKEIINTNLLSQGWQQQDVNEAFSAVENQNVVIPREPQIIFTSKKNNKTLIFSIVGILLLLGLGIGGFFLFSKIKTSLKMYVAENTNPVAKEITTTESLEEIVKNETASWKIYTDDNLGFEFKYPSTFVIGKYIDKPLPPTSYDDEMQKNWEHLGYTQQEIEETTHPFRKSIVLVEKDLSKYFDDLQMIPVGEGVVISITPHIEKNSGHYFDLMEGKIYENMDIQKIKNDSFNIAKFPGYPGPYGYRAFYYILKADDNLALEFMGLKKYPEGTKSRKSESDTGYDQIIEKIMSTFKLTK